MHTPTGYFFHFDRHPNGNVPSKLRPGRDAWLEDVNFASVDDRLAFFPAWLAVVQRQRAAGDPFSEFNQGDDLFGESSDAENSRFTAAEQEQVSRRLEDIRRLLLERTDDPAIRERTNERIDYFGPLGSALSRARMPHAACQNAGMVVEFECRTRLLMGVQEAFDRSRSIELHTASMAASRERAVSGVTSGLIGLGEVVTWRAWHFGVPIRMTSRITEMRSPDWFVDEQVRGPFASFRHEHRFVGDGDGTLMIDFVRFQAPLGVAGRAAEVVLGPYLRRLIERRNAHLAGASADPG